MLFVLKLYTYVHTYKANVMMIYIKYVLDNLSISERQTCQKLFDCHKAIIHNRLYIRLYITVHRVSGQHIPIHPGTFDKSGYGHAIKYG